MSVRRVQLRRGTTAENNSFTGAVGEITVDTTLSTIRVHDGVTQGGTATTLPTLENIAPDTDVDFNSQKIINVSDPTNPQDVATKAYVDSGGGITVGELSDVTLTNLGEAQFLVYDNNNDSRWENITFSGDISVTALGVVSLTADAIQTANIQNGQVTNAKLANSTIAITDGTVTDNLPLGQTLTFTATNNETTIAVTNDDNNANGTVVTIGLPDDVTIGQDLSVTRNLTVGGDLTVSGTLTTINTDQLTIDDPIMVVNSGDAASDIGLFMTNPGASDNQIFIFDNTDQIFKLAQAPGNTTGATADFNPTVYSDLKLKSLTTTGAITVATTLGVSGTTTLSGFLNANAGIAVDTDKFVVADTTGNTSIDGTLSVTGQSTLASGSTVGDIEITNGQIQTTNGNNSLSFNDNNLSTTGTLTIGSTSTLTGDVTAQGSVLIEKDADHSILLNSDVVADNTPANASIAVALSNGPTYATITWNNGTSTWDISNNLSTALDLTVGQDLVVTRNLYLTDSSTNGITFRHDENAGADETLIRVDRGGSHATLSWDESSAYFSVSNGLNIVGAISQGAVDGVSNFTVSNAGVITTDSNGHQLAGLTFSGTTIEAATNGAGIDFGNENVSTTGNWTSLDITSTGNASFNTATVSGLLTLTGGLTAENFSVADNTGNTSIGGTLTVTSTITAAAQGSQIADFTFNNGSLTSATGTIDFGDENLTTTGTLGAGATTVTSLNASSGNITSVGEISLGTISSAGTTVVVAMDDNIPGAFEIKEGATSYIKVDTTNTAELITVAQETTFSNIANFSDTLNADAALTVDGSFTANGGITADNFTVADTTGNTSIGGTLIVASTLTANGGIIVDTDKFVVADTTGNTSIDGTLSVTGESTLASGSTVGDIEITNGQIQTTNGNNNLSFNDNNLSTTGTLGAGDTTVTSLNASTGNITNVGEISLGTISSVGTTVVVAMDDNVAGSFEIKEGATSYIKVDTTDNSELITVSKNITFTGTASFTNGAIGLNGGNIVVNEDGNTFDFRVEGDNQTHLLFTDGTNDRVGINESAPATQFHVNGVTTLAGALNVRSDDLAQNPDAQNAIILLNSDATGNGAERDAKIEVERGALTNSYIQWDESEDEWLISNALNSAGNLTIGADVFTVDASNGNTSVGGTLGVTGAITATAVGSQIADFTFNNGSLTSGTGTINFNDENLTTTGSITCTNMTVNGTLTTINSTDLDVTDSVIRLNQGIANAENSRDIGLFFERGVDGNGDAVEDGIFFFDEGDDTFKMGTTTVASTATDFGDPNTWGDLKIGTLTTTSTITSVGVVNANGGIAVDTDKFTVDGATYNLGTTGEVLVTKTSATAFKVETGANAEIFNIDTNTPKVTITSALFEPDAGINVGADVFSVSNVGVTSILNTLNVTTGSASAFVVEKANGTDVLNVDTTSSVTTVTGQLKTDDLRASSAATGSFKINLVDNIENALEIKDLGAGGNADSYMTFDTREGSELITLVQPTSLSSTLSVTGQSTLKGEVSVESNTNGILFNSELTGNGDENDAVLITVERGVLTNAIISWDETNDEFNVNAQSGLHLQGKAAGNALTVGDTSSAGTTTAVLTTAGALTLSSSLTVAGINMGESAISNVTDIAINTLSDNDGNGVIVQLADTQPSALVIREGTNGESYLTINTTALTTTLNQSTSTTADFTVGTTLTVTGQSTLDDTLNIKTAPTNNVAILVNSDTADADVSIFKVNDTTANVQLDWDGSEGSFVVKGGKLHSETQVTVGGTITTAPNFTVATSGAVSTLSTVTATNNIKTSTGVIAIDTPSQGAILFNSDDTAEQDAHDFGITVSRPTAGTNAIFYWDEGADVWQFNGAGNVQAQGSIVADSDQTSKVVLAAGSITTGDNSGIDFGSDALTTTGNVSTTAGGTLTVNGATTLESTLQVDGIATFNESVTIATTKTLTLNQGVANAAADVDAFIYVDRGTDSNTFIQWDEGVTRWLLSNDGGVGKVILHEDDTLFSLTTDSGGGSTYSFNQKTNNALTLEGTANQISVTNTNGTVTVGLPNTVTITGDLNVNSITSLGATVRMTDPLIFLGSGQANQADTGYYFQYRNDGLAIRFGGLVFQPDEAERFVLFSDNTTLNSNGSDSSIPGSDSDLALLDLATVRGGRATGADSAGSSLTVSGGASTGSGAGGSIVFETTSAGASGSTLNSGTTALTIDSAQKATFEGEVEVDRAGSKYSVVTVKASEGSRYECASPAFATNAVSISAPDAVENKHAYFLSNGGTAGTVNLFDLTAGYDGYVLQIFNTGTNTLTVDGSGVQEVDGAETKDVVQGASLTLMAYGTAWYVV
jgi:hypothetical protein